MWFFIKFPSGCCFALLRPDAVPFEFLRRSLRLFLMCLTPLRMLLELLGTFLEASWGDLGAKLGCLGATFGALRFFIFF